MKGHVVLPEFLDHTMERDFVKGDADPNSAVDPGVGGFGNNPGHGTATMSLLAGRTLDGSPFDDPSGLVGALRRHATLHQTRVTIDVD